MITLYDKLGGLESVEKLVDIFYHKVLADSRLSFFFKGVDMNMIHEKQRGFLCMVLGGPKYYKPIDLRYAHADLVTEQGLNDTHFDLVLEHLRDTLSGLKISSADILTVMSIAESTRKDVLNR